MIEVRGVWYVEREYYIIELLEGKLVRVNIEPYRVLSEADFKPYGGPHPRQIKGILMASYLYELYGLEKEDIGMTESVRIRLTSSEREKYENYCESMGIKMSEHLREYIRTIIV